MKRVFKSIGLCTALFVGAGTLYSVPAFAAAQCDAEEKIEGEMGEDTYGVVQKAMEMLSKDQVTEAIAKLAEIANKGSDYEKGLVNYNLGIAYSTLNDYPNAAKAFVKALSVKALPRQQREQLQYNVGQLFIVTNQYDDGIKALQTYMAQACDPVPAEAHIFLANALTERKRFEEALPQIDEAIAKSKEVKELWLQMKLAISYELKDYKRSADALLQLIAKVPAKAEYWRQLSSVLFEMDDRVQSLAVLALAEKQGFLEKPAEIRNLYSIYMMLESPYKAGSLLETAMAAKRLPADEENLSSLSDAWINARELEKAEATLLTLADMSDKGDYYYKLGAMYGDNERWRDSKQMLEKALKKGGLKSPGEVWMRLAVAHYGMKDNRGAISALQKAITFDDSRRQAGEWLRALSGTQQAEAVTEEASNAVDGKS